jgi:concentrative nucleoside transporter, CNT family
MRGLLGIAVLLLFAWAISEDRSAVPKRVVLGGVLLQFVLAVVMLKLPWAAKGFLWLNDGVQALQKATEAGTGFVFGYLGGAPLPFVESHPGAAFIFAFRALPLVLVISALATLLFYWGVLQRIVGAFAWLLRGTVGIRGPLGLGAAVHIFVGHIEAPLLIRPYLLRLQRGELFALMSCGMAGIAGTVMVLYASILGPVIPGALGHILVAAVISTPAALALAGLMVPFQTGLLSADDLNLADPRMTASAAALRGDRTPIDAPGAIRGIDGPPLPALKTDRPAIDSPEIIRRIDGPPLPPLPSRADSPFIASSAIALQIDDPPISAMDAIAKGTRDGIVFLLNIIAMLVVLVALVSVANSVLGLLPDLAGEAITLQRLAAYAFRPVMWLIGIPGSQVDVAAHLMGTKVVLNEFVAYIDLAKVPADQLDDHSRLIMMYAMCGFANFGSLGIMIGGMGAMVPERRAEIVALGLRSILSGTLAGCMSGAIVGMLV